MSVEFDLFHDGQFWVGVLSLLEDGAVRATKVVFGAEPSDAEVHQYLLRHGFALLARADQAPGVPASQRSIGRGNPKRAARLAARQAIAKPSTASQDALRLALEVTKEQRSAQQRLNREGQVVIRREQRRVRAKAKHRGR